MLCATPRPSAVMVHREEEVAVAQASRRRLERWTPLERLPAALRPRQIRPARIARWAERDWPPNRRARGCPRRSRRCPRSRAH
eukprot:4540733-Pyramimonas_sp.AAC.1